MEPGTPGVPDAGVVQLVSTVACQVIDAGSNPVACLNSESGTQNLKKIYYRRNHYEETI